MVMLVSLPPTWVLFCTVQKSIVVVVVMMIELDREYPSATLYR